MLLMYTAFFAYAATLVSTDTKHGVLSAIIYFAASAACDHVHALIAVTVDNLAPSSGDGTSTGSNLD